MTTYDDMRAATVANIIAGIKQAYREAKADKAEKPPTDKDIIEVLTRNGPDAPGYVSTSTFKRHKKENASIREVLDGMQESFTPYRDPETAAEDPTHLKRIIKEQAKALGRLATYIDQLEHGERSIVPDDLSGLDKS